MSGIVKREEATSRSPLADRMRPRSLRDFVGQHHLLGEGKILQKLIQKKLITSLIFWGPPGCGKTTLAHLLANEWEAHLISLSAVLIGLKEIREAIETAKAKWLYEKARTILLIDEIHRFNKVQQDALLPHVEKGTITLFGITTENPSFQDAIERIIALADSDARMALNLLELSVLGIPVGEKETTKVTRALVDEICQAKPLLYDKAGEEHFNLISALHKSLRGSDPDAGLYYLARMLLAGEDPLYIARRLVRFASEDIGLADPGALNIAINAVKAYQMLGSPEGELALAEAVVYLATAPKSNAIYTAFGKAQDVAREKGALPVPLKLRNAPTRLMKEAGYGKDYKYPHDYDNAYVEETYLPDEISDIKFYHPTDRGEEKVIRQRIESLKKKK